MKNLFEKLETLASHFKHFGADGFKFLWKKKFNKAALVDIRPKRYVHPIYLRKHTTDVDMFYYIFQAKEYDMNFDFVPKVIIDCGAHIGLGAVFFANKFPEARIIAVEPEKSNFDLLVKNTAPYSNVKCMNYGIWNRTTHLKIVDIGVGNWGYMTEEVSVKDNNTVEAISIGDIMNKYAIDEIDICKINIEGTEKELFEKNHEEWTSKTKAIVIELHDGMREGCTKSFINAMMNYDFSLTPYGSYLVCTINKK